MNLELLKKYSVFDTIIFFLGIVLIVSLFINNT